jgi:glyoxylase-like metal-dependent hydrolase (beta-lactamase superfamily II)
MPRRLINGRAGSKSSVRAPAMLILAIAFLSILIVDAILLFRRYVPAGIKKAVQVDTVVPQLDAADTPSSTTRDCAPPLVPYPIKLASGLYLLGGMAPSAVYVVETSEGLVLIDSGLQSQASLLESQLAAVGLDPKQTRAILLTHAHVDHSGGAEQLRRETGAKTYAGRGDAGALRAGGPREALSSAFDFPADPPHRTTVDVELQGGESISFGDVRFRALATPGHTPGSICYLMECSGQRVLFTGDVVSMLLGEETSPVPIRRPLGTYSAYLAPRYRGDARAYLSSLEELRAISVPDLVLPGHPRGDPTPQYPCISPERWKALLEQGKTDLETLLARYQSDGADFLDGDPRPLLPGLYYLGDFEGVAVYGFSAASKVFLVNAPGGPGLLDFVQDRLGRLGVEPAVPNAVLLTSSPEEEPRGLKRLIEQCHTQVVAASAWSRSIKSTCGEGTVVVPAEELAGRSWFKVTAIPLRGPAIAAMAYRVEWAGKSVLFSGGIPIKARGDAEALLFAEVSKSREATMDYLVAINRLSSPAPDLWLPAVPADCQNANVYGEEWHEVINYNYRLGYRSLIQPR